MWLTFTMKEATKTDYLLYLKEFIYSFTFKFARSLVFIFKISKFVNKNNNSGFQYDKPKNAQNVKFFAPFSTWFYVNYFPQNPFKC